MKPVAQRVLENIRRQALLTAGCRIAVAVSGGLDSVALLRLIIELRPELGVVVSAVHFNHQLRAAESDADEQFVANLARAHDLEFYCDRGDVPALASKMHLSLEAAARRARYQFFERLLSEHAVDCIATAHTLDDQAETVVLRLSRGAGTRGLAGIYPRVLLASDSTRAIIRPLLGIRRHELKAYVTALAQDWREDRSNRDLRHSRNRVRYGILPRLERHLNPAVRDALAETAEIARGEEEYWQHEVARQLPTVETSKQALKLPELLQLPLALQRRIIRSTAESRGLQLEFGQVEEILRVANGVVASVQLSTRWVVCRHGVELHFLLQQPVPTDYEYPLPISVATFVPEAQLCLEAVLIAVSERLSADALLDPALILQSGLTVRNWRPGDRFWPLHAKAPKKIKELLQARHITGPERQNWPVVAAGPDVVWLRGFAVSSRFLLGEHAHEALVIRERPL